MRALRGLELKAASLVPGSSRCNRDLIHRKARCGSMSALEPCRRQAVDSRRCHISLRARTSSIGNEFDVERVQLTRQIVVRGLPTVRRELLIETAQRVTNLWEHVPEFVCPTLKGVTRAGSVDEAGLRANVDCERIRSSAELQRCCVEGQPRNSEFIAFGASEMAPGFAALAVLSAVAPVLYQPPLAHAAHIEIALRTRSGREEDPDRESTQKYAAGEHR